jgi:threonine synthase
LPLLLLFFEEVENQRVERDHLELGRTVGAEDHFPDLSVGWNMDSRPAVGALERSCLRSSLLCGTHTAMVANRPQDVKPADFSELVDERRQNIWRYAACYEPDVSPQYRLTLGEGWTRALRLPALDRLTGLELYLKREDLNPCGSHKARSLAYQVSLALQRGERDLIISSSGNAAVAAAAYSALAGIRLHAFVAPGTHPVKLAELLHLGARVIVSTRALNAAKRAALATGFTNLRPSTNDASIEGFKSIALELYEQVGTLDALFTFVSSGSSFCGIGRAYRQLCALGCLDQPPRLFAVRAAAGGETAPESFSAGAEMLSGMTGRPGELGVRRSRRSTEIAALASWSGGGVVEVDGEETAGALAALNHCGIDTSLEGAAALAAAMRLARDGLRGRVAVILTGHASQRPAEPLDPARLLRADTDEEVLALFEKNYRHYVSK